MKRFLGAVASVLVGCASVEAYTSLGHRVYLSDGSAADTQAAIDAVPDGATVEIPNGTHTWSSGVVITGKGIHLRGQSAGGSTLAHSIQSGDLLTVAESPERSVEISDLRFVARGGQGRHLVVNGTRGGQPVLLHDCYFETRDRVGRSIQWQTNGGVIWNCSFYSNGQDASACAFKLDLPNDRSWRSPSTMGTADRNGTANTYIEDCTFRDIYLQALDFDGNSRTVVRHCTFDNSAITSHGQDTGPASNRHWEVYDNTFVFTPDGTTSSGHAAPLPLCWWVFLRGGTGVIADNVMPDIKSQTWGDKAEILMTVYNIRRASQFISCQTSYPASEQLGQSYGTDGPITEPVYLWGNTGGGNYDNPALEDYGSDDCGNGQTVFGSANPYSPVYLEAGRDYITSTAKPGYAKYPYPHPLRTPAPVPSPQQPRIPRHHKNPRTGHQDVRP